MNRSDDENTRKINQALRAEGGDSFGSSFMEPKNPEKKEVAEHAEKKERPKRVLEVHMTMEVM